MIFLDKQTAKEQREAILWLEDKLVRAWEWMMRLLLLLRKR